MLLKKLSLMTAVGFAGLLLLTGCGADPSPQPAPRGAPANAEELKVTLLIPEMADRLELM